MADVAISTEGLVKRYGRNRGLAGLDRAAGAAGTWVFNRRDVAV